MKRFKVSITRGGACARLHEAMGWWRARRLDFTRYKHVDGDPPPRTRGATTTEHVEGGKGATASVPPVAAAAAAKATARELAFKEKARRPQVAKRSRKDTTGTEWAYRLLVRMSGVAQSVVWNVCKFGECTGRPVAGRMDRDPRLQLEGACSQEGKLVVHGWRGGR